MTILSKGDIIDQDSWILAQIFPFYLQQYEGELTPFKSSNPNPLQGEVPFPICSFLCIQSWKENIDLS